MESNPPVPLEVPLEVDEDADTKTDSAYDESIGSASYISSLSSSVKNYKYENGRRYHAYREGAYIAPNDEDEQDRMDFLHHIYLLMLDGKFQLAPINPNLQRVLDIGTGTGIWALQFADEFPSAQVIGTDLSPIQPSWVPTNCIFEVDDFEDVWPYHTPFDFIHGRELEGCIADEEKLFRQAFEHLRPGGWFEIDSANSHFLSDDGTHEQAENIQLWLREARNAANKFGKPLDSAPNWKEKLEKVGFVDVREIVSKLPLNPWPKDPKLKELGRFQQIQQMLGIKSYTPALFQRMLGWSELEVEVLLAGIQSELTKKSHHIYVPIHFVWGRKPVS